MDAKQTQKEAAAENKRLQANVDHQRQTLEIEGAGVINKESINALATIKPHDMQKAAVNIDNNREDIHEAVDNGFKGKEELLSRGLATIRDIMSGNGQKDQQEDNTDIEDAEFTEVDDDADHPDKPWKDAQGNSHTFDDGRPITNAHMRDYDERQGKPVKRKGDDKPFVGEDGKKQYFDDGDEITVGDRRQLDDEDIRKARAGKRAKPADRAHSDSKKLRDGKSVLLTVLKYSLLAGGVAAIAFGAGPLAAIIGRGMLDIWQDMPNRSMAAADDDEDEDRKTVDEIITQSISYLKNYELEDLHDVSKQMFKSLASAEPDKYALTVTALQPYIVGRPTGRVGKSLYGYVSPGVTLVVLASKLERAMKAVNVFVSVERHVDDATPCYIFHCKDLAGR